MSNNNNLPHAIWEGKVYQLTRVAKRHQPFEKVCIQQCHLNDVCDALCKSTTVGTDGLSEILGVNCSDFDEVSGAKDDRAAVWKEVE